MELKIFLIGAGNRSFEAEVGLLLATQHLKEKETIMPNNNTTPNKNQPMKNDPQKREQNPSKGTPERKEKKDQR